MTESTNTATNSSVYIRGGERCQLHDSSEATAHRELHTLNNELSAKGYITLAGRTNRAYFMQKVCGHPAIERGA